MAEQNIFSGADQIVAVAEKYFLMNREDVLNVIYNKLRTSRNVERMKGILAALSPQLEKYQNVTSDDLKRKVGRVIFKTLNFTTFSPDENPRQTYFRLKKLFEETTSKGINPYEICYVTVLNQSQLFLDNDGRHSDYKERVGSFLSVFDMIKDTLKEKKDGGYQPLEDRKVVKLFERCSSLLSKATTDKVVNNFDEICYLGDPYKDKRYTIFSYADVVDICRNNPSLFTISTKRIVPAFNYVKEKAEKYLRLSGKYMAGESLKNVIHDWLVNNSSLFTIKVEEMTRKENALQNYLFQIFPHEQVAVLINNIFTNPTNIAYINKISKDDFFGRKDERSNYAMVIYELYKACNGNKAVLYEYLSNNCQIYGVSAKNLHDVLQEIKERDGDGNDLMQKFLAAGDRMVAYVEGNKNGSAVDALEKDKVLLPIKLYNMSKKEIAQTFFDVFDYHNKNKSFEELERLLWVNYDNNEFAKKFEHIEKNLDELVGLYGGDDLLEVFKDKKRKGEIIEKGREILEGLESYLAQINASYKDLSKEEIDYALRKYEGDVEELYEVIDKLYQENIESARKVYKNPDELYSTFRENTHSKFDLAKSPRRQITAFAKRFCDEILKPASAKDLDTKTYRQMSIFELPDANLGDGPAEIQLPNDEEFKPIKRQYKKIAGVLNGPSNDNPIIIR